jgi:hypothetical protein
MLDDVRAEDVAPIPLGHGALHAESLTNASGDHAILLLEDETSRILLLTEPGRQEGGRERVIVVPFDEDVETRVDGDALAKWIAAPDLLGSPEGIPRLASALGLILLVGVLALTVIGAGVVFSWILDALGM